MTRPLVLAISGLTLAAMAQAGAQSRPKFAARVDLVVVSAVVRDGENQFARALTAADFEVLEDGKPVAVATFAEVNADTRAPQDDGRFVVLLLDNLVTDPVLTHRIKEIARGFADRMGPRDVVSVLAMNGGNTTATSDPAAVRAAIDRVKPFGTSIMSGSARSTLGMDAVTMLARQLSPLAHRRKVLVCVGPAGLFNVQLSEDALMPDGHIMNAIRLTSRADLTTYVIDPLGLTDPRGTKFINDGELKHPADTSGSGNVTRGMGVYGNLDGFPRDSGGAVFSNVNVYEPAIDQVWQESGNYYLFGFEPTKRDNRRHTIEVRVKKPGLQVRARRTRG